MQNLYDDAKPLIVGHLLIRDKDTGEVIISKRDVEYTDQYRKKDNKEE